MSQITPGRIFRSQNGRANRLRAELEYEHNLGKTLRQMDRELDGALFFDHDHKKVRAIYDDLLRMFNHGWNRITAPHDQTAKTILSKIIVQADWEKWGFENTPERRINGVFHDKIYNGPELARITANRSKAGFEKLIFKDALVHHITSYYDLSVAQILIEQGNAACRDFGMAQLKSAVKSYFNGGGLMREFNNQSNLANWPGRLLAYTDTLIANENLPKKTIEAAKAIQSQIAEIQADHEETALRNARAPFLRPTV